MEFFRHQNCFTLDGGISPFASSRLWHVICRQNEKFICNKTKPFSVRSGVAAGCSDIWGDKKNKNKIVPIIVIAVTNNHCYYDVRNTDIKVCFIIVLWISWLIIRKNKEVFLLQFLSHIFFPLKKGPWFCHPSQNKTKPFSARESMVAH